MEIRRKISLVLVCLFASICFFAGCSTTEAPNSIPNENTNTAKTEPILVRFVLDWTPNTNHTGIYVAEQLGYYAEEGLELEILQPDSSTAPQLVASGQGDIGVSFQDELTFARMADVPIISIAALLPHNTSCFAGKGIKTPADFVGKRYGSWGGAIEPAFINYLLTKNGQPANSYEMIEIGSADFLAAVQRDVDFSWIYYGWTGIAAELMGEELDLIWLVEEDANLDYYTPVLITSETFRDEQPEVIEKFLRATAKGYAYAQEKPVEAAELLLQAVPELDQDIVIASQKWLSEQMAGWQWGYQEASVWMNFSEWLTEQGLIAPGFVPEDAYTNAFLPQ